MFCGSYHHVLLISIKKRHSILSGARTVPKSLFSHAVQLLYAPPNWPSKCDCALCLRLSIYCPINRIEICVPPLGHITLDAVVNISFTYPFLIYDTLQHFLSLLFGLTHNTVSSTPRRLDPHNIIESIFLCRCLYAPSKHPFVSCIPWSNAWLLVRVDLQKINRLAFELGIVWFFIWLTISPSLGPFRFLPLWWLFSPILIFCK